MVLDDQGWAHGVVQLGVLVDGLDGVLVHELHASHIDAHLHHRRARVNRVFHRVERADHRLLGLGVTKESKLGLDST
jgi:cyanophycinase-like exopeptidase